MITAGIRVGPSERTLDFYTKIYTLILYYAHYLLHNL